MKHRFKNVLQKEVQREKIFDTNQDKLKNKYGIDKDVVVVEKANILKTLGVLVMAIAKILLLFLATFGLIALIYPEPRAEVLKIFNLSISEILKLMRV